MPTKSINSFAFMHDGFDSNLFRWIDSQTTTKDRIALLSLQQILVATLGSYSYLEVGSHLGGSLQPHVISTKCKEVYSIDPRPERQPDERRSEGFTYPNNSTNRMLALLSRIPGADLRKVKTFECCSWEVDETLIPDRVDCAFIDGEHTNITVVKDFHAVRRLLKHTGILAFHDSHIIIYALVQIHRLLRQESGSQHQFFHFPGSAITAIVFDRQLAVVMDRYGWAAGLPISGVQYFRIILYRQVGVLYRALMQCRQLIRKPYV